MSEPIRETIGMRTMFWTWMTLITGGLIFIIVTALSGR